MQPYIQKLSKNEVCIIVETNSKNKPLALYGVNKNLNNKSLSSFYINPENKKITYLHRIYLKELKENEIYYYKVIDGKSESDTFKFKTLSDSPNYLKVAIYGDNRSNPEVFSKITYLISSHNPDFVLSAGDITYNYSYSSFKKEFFIKNNLNLMSNYCVFNSPGNHEGWSKNTKAFFENPIDASGTQDYFSFTVGDSYFLVLNNEIDYSENSKQWNFVENDLKECKAKNKFVLFHRPAYATGKHGEDKKMINMTKKLFEPNGIKMAFTGHCHFYERNFSNGIYHLVLGGAGSPLHNFTYADYVQKQAKKYHYAILEIFPEKIKFTIYDINNIIIDYFEI